MNGAPRALALTSKAWQALAAIPPPFKGICSHCGQTAYVWAGKVACVDRTGDPVNRYGRECPGNGKPPRKAKP